MRMTGLLVPRLILHIFEISNMIRSSTRLSEKDEDSSESTMCRGGMEWASNGIGERNENGIDDLVLKVPLIVDRYRWRFPFGQKLPRLFAPKQLKHPEAPD